MKLAKTAAFALLAGIALWATQPTSRAQSPSAPTAAPSLRTAVFAGGCFWCMEKPFDSIVGVQSTISGYTGGRTAKPSYEEVASGTTGHAEVVQVTYDPTKVTYEQLLEVFWRNVDPFDAGGQFCDRGSQYRSAVFVANDAERRAAEMSKQALEQRLGRKIATTIDASAPFYAAEEYHQDYYRKNPLRYRYYRGGCGRDNRLKAVWGQEAGGSNVAGVKYVGAR